MLKNSGDDGNQGGMRHEGTGRTPQSLQDRYARDHGAAYATEGYEEIGLASQSLRGFKKKKKKTTNLLS